jgi:hypothetical protein
MMEVQQDSWKKAAIYASNLSNMETKLGRLAAAVQDAAQSVDFADRSRDAFQRMSKRVRLASALHTQGAKESALKHCREAEALQAQNRSRYSMLYSIRCFREHPSPSGA